MQNVATTLPPLAELRCLGGKTLKILFKGLFLLLLAAVLIGNLWGYLTLGSLTPANTPDRDPNANAVVMVFGATGSVGDGLLKAALNDPEVQEVHIVTRRSSPRIESAAAQGASVHMLSDFTDYQSVQVVLGRVNTVLWALGTSSLNVDDATYTRIHVDFPLAFVDAWRDAGGAGPKSFHFVTGMGTDPEGKQHWAREKGRTENTLAALGEEMGMRSFSYRSGFVRPTAEQSNPLHYFGEWLLKPGKLVISATELGEAMLEISARTQELPNGTLIDNGDSVAYARAYRYAPQK